LYVIDLAILAGVIVSTAIALTGGGVFYILDWRITATSVLNPLLATLWLAVLRCSVGPGTFLGIGWLNLDRARRAAMRSWRRAYDVLAGLSRADAFRWLLLLASASLAIKLFNIDVHFGFWTGDDVEIQEMTIGKVLGASWPVWDLRCAFYPIGFVYPIQAAVFRLGVRNVRSLVLSGRVVVAVWSTFDVWLTYWAASRAFRSIPIGLLAAIVLVSSKLHVMSGSIELPAAVATAFLLLAFGLLNQDRGGLWRPSAAGLALGVAAALRFSEGIFIVPAACQLIGQRRRRAFACCSLAFVAAAAVAVAASDWAYWGRPFFSLQRVIDYTLIQRASSRGYQPFYEYARFYRWSDALTVGLALYAIRLRPWPIAVWTWVPVLLLTTLPHKEVRYLIPVVPFLSMSAAITLWHIVGRLRRAQDDGARAAGLERRAGALAMACVAAFATEASSFNFSRTESAVQLATYLARQPFSSRGAVEQLWRMGGRVYFPPGAELIDIDPGRVDHRLDLVATLMRYQPQWLALGLSHTRDDELVKRLGYRLVWLPAEFATSGYRVYVRDTDVGSLPDAR